MTDGAFSSLEHKLTMIGLPKGWVVIKDLKCAETALILDEKCRDVFRVDLREKMKLADLRLLVGLYVSAYADRNEAVTV